MRQKLTTLALFVLAYGLATWGVLAQPVELPAIPDGSPLVRDTMQRCSDEIGMYEHGFDTRSHAPVKDYDVLVLGVLRLPDRRHGEALVYFVFGGKDNAAIEAVYLTLPGKPVEQITREELGRRWPNECALLQELYGDREAQGA